MAGPKGREFELKLELTPAQLQRVNEHPALRNLTVGQPVRRTLRSIYFDTPDYRLRAAGISLRARHDGAVWQQTVKSDTRVRHGVSQPVELEAVLPDSEPDLNAIVDRHLRRAIQRMVRGTLLEAVFETVVTRTERQLHTNNSDLELVLDQGIVRAGSAEKALCEAELELKAGAADSLLQVATELFAEEVVHPAATSKAGRGYNLLLGHTAATPRPHYADHVELEKNATCGEALTLIVQSAAQQILANRRVVRDTDDPEGAHQLRIGLRRLRSALKAFRPLLDTTAASNINDRARAVARAVGELRDADVPIDAIYPPAARTVTGHPGLEPLKSALITHRRDRRDHARAALEDRDWSALQLYLALWPHAIADRVTLDQPLVEFTGTAMNKAWKRVAKKGKRLEVLNGEERHEMRKALKELRYTFEFFGGLYEPGDVRPFVKAVKKLQDVFGYLNDVEAARHMQSISAERCGNNGDAQCAAGYVIGWHSAKAAACWSGVESKWQDLKARPRFWR